MNPAHTATQTIAAPERTLLRPIDHATFFAALDNPPAPTAKLRNAFRRHSETISNR